MFQLLYATSMFFSPVTYALVKNTLHRVGIWEIFVNQLFLTEEWNIFATFKFLMINTLNW